MIADVIEESLSLDYKRGDSPNMADDKRKADIVRDVTAMANSSGGISIYGIAEFSEKAPQHSTVFADEMPSKRATLSIRPTVNEWTTVA